jgi:hypothetical protein
MVVRRRHIDLARCFHAAMASGSLGSVYVNSFRLWLHRNAHPSLRSANGMVPAALLPDVMLGWGVGSENVCYRELITRPRTDGLALPQFGGLLSLSASVA